MGLQLFHSVKKSPRGCLKTVKSLSLVHTCNVTAYCDSVDGTRDHVTYQKLVTQSRYGLVRCAVGISLSHQRVDKVTA